LALRVLTGSQILNIFYVQSNILGLPATSSGLVASKTDLRATSLSLSSFSVLTPDDEDRDGSRNVGLLVVKPPDAAGSSKIFYRIQLPVVRIVAFLILGAVYNFLELGFLL
jgi:hypothetical protein